MTESKQPTFAYNLSILDSVDSFQLKHTWLLPKSLINRLDRHYLIYWDRKFLTDRDGLQDGKVLSHQSRSYIVHLTEPADKYSICSRIALSFRHPIGTKFGWVLISPAVKRWGYEAEH